MGLSGSGSGPEQPLIDCLVRRRAHYDIHVSKIDYLYTGLKRRIRHTVTVVSTAFKKIKCTNKSMERITPNLHFPSTIIEVLKAQNDLKLSLLNSLFSVYENSVEFRDLFGFNFNRILEFKFKKIEN